MEAEEVFETGHVAGVAGAVDQGGAEDGVGEGGGLAKLDQFLLSHQFAAAVEAVGLAGGGFAEGGGAGAGHGPDGADEDDPFHSGGDGLFNQVLGPQHVGLVEGLGVDLGFLGDVGVGGQVDDGVDAPEGGGPVGMAVNGADDGGVGMSGVGSTQGGDEGGLGQGTEALG